MGEDRFQFIRQPNDAPFSIFGCSGKAHGSRLYVDLLPCEWKHLTPETLPGHIGELYGRSRISRELGKVARETHGAQRILAGGRFFQSWDMQLPVDALRSQCQVVGATECSQFPVYFRIAGFRFLAFSNVSLDVSGSNLAGVLDRGGNCHGGGLRREDSHAWSFWNFGERARFPESCRLALPRADRPSTDRKGWEVRQRERQAIESKIL